ncbi:IncF plasmid conjugative transfer pilus assembly protein TraC [Candidatus Burkholderia pumila]|uniref:IncF plasmid conjugative transfer pilus assembly protein TraC n=1 Tax=Candidatus Burkholderia pumila TaxID=1090375 RepID=A0ABR5HPK6_9BURK|nr:IncF plasmid conjugative transfer pilus assembly protein TraC [Candidatus Burkholderia pumila]
MSPAGLHQILKYDQYDEKTGLFFQRQRGQFLLLRRSPDGCRRRYGQPADDLFTPIPPGTGVQWCLFGSTRVDALLEHYEDLRHEAVEAGKVDPMFLEIARRRTDYIRSMQGQSLWESTPFLVKQTRLVFSVTRSGSHADHTLVSDMADLKSTLMSSLRAGKLPARHMDADDLIAFLFPIFNPEYLFNSEPMPDLRYDPTRPIREQVTAFGHRARVRTTEILFGVPPADDESDTRVATRAFGVQRYPRKEHLWEMTGIIGWFTDTQLQYPCPYLICGGIFTLDRNVVDSCVQVRTARCSTERRIEDSQVPAEPGCAEP